VSRALSSLRQRKRAAGFPFSRAERDHELLK